MLEEKQIKAFFVDNNLSINRTVTKHQYISIIFNAYKLSDVFGKFVCELFTPSGAAFHYDFTCWDDLMLYYWNFAAGYSKKNLS